MIDWKKEPIGEHFDFQNGFAFSSKDFSNVGNYYVVKIKELKNGQIRFFDDSAKVYISNTNDMKKYEINNGDILFALTGDPISKPNPLSWVGRVAIFEHNLTAMLNQRVCKVVIKSNKIMPKFLYYFFRVDDNFYTLAAKATGSASQANISTKTISDTLICFPSLTDQRKIVDLLSTIDRKILLNTKTNNNLEQQAQAIFKSWFVDFEPFGGTMPSDWEYGKVSDISEIHDSKRVPLSSNQRNNMKKIYPYYGAASLMDYVEDYLFNGIYLLLGEDGTVSDSKGYPILQYVWGKFWVNNHAHILTGKNGYNVESLYLLFKQTPITSIITGAVQAKISQSNLNSLDVIIPDASIMGEFNSIIAPMFAKIRSLTDENERLSQLRDTLLPKLMSGEIDVENIDISTDKLSFICLLIVIYKRNNEHFILTFVIIIGVIMKKFLSLIFSLFLFCSVCFAGTTNSYDSYGSKTGSYRTNGNTTTSYDKYGSKTGSFKTSGNTTTSYDKYGNKTGSYKQTATGYDSYDKYGNKTGSYKTNSNRTTTSYDKYGNKTGSFKKDSSGRITEYDKYGRKVGSYK